MVVMDISHANQQEFDTYTQINIETQTLCTQYTWVKCHMSNFVFVYIQILDHRRVKYVVYIDGNLLSSDVILALNINLEHWVGCKSQP